MAVVLAVLAMVVAGMNTIGHGNPVQRDQNQRMSSSATPNSDCGDDCFWS
jgi:hypothetical protein